MNDLFSLISTDPTTFFLSAIVLFALLISLTKRAYIPLFVDLQKKFVTLIGVVIALTILYFFLSAIYQ